MPAEIGQGSVPQFSSSAIERCRCSRGLEDKQLPTTVSKELHLERVVGLNIVE